MTHEGGKPFIENHDEVGWTAACFDYYGEIARDSVGYLPAPIEPQQLALVVKEPVGVVACIVPWNFPLLLAAWKVAPALAAGNSVLLKPSEETPLATRRMIELMDDLPDGVLQGVYGAGDVGDALVRHPGVDMVAFTGSQATGQKVAHVAADRLIPGQPRAGWQGPVHHLRRRGHRDRRAGRRVGRVPERRAGLHLLGALLRDEQGGRRLRRGFEELRRDPEYRRPDGPLDGHRAHDQRPRPREGRAPRRGGAGEGREARRRRRAVRETGASSTSPPSSPALRRP